MRQIKGLGAKDETRNTKLEERRGEIEIRGVAGSGLESVRVQKGKELVGAVSAGRVARGDFTGHDSAGWLSCTVPILELVLTVWEQTEPVRGREF